jgi:hypothetical protein
MNTWQGLVAVGLLTTGMTVTMAEDSGMPHGWKTPMGPKGTAYEAARRIFPGATLDDQDKLVLDADKTLRMPGTTRRRAELPEGTTLDSPWFPLTIRSQGKTFTVLLWEGERPANSENGGMGPSVAVAAVFPQGSIEPTDVAELKQDRDTTLGEVIKLGEEDAFIVRNTHGNSGQFYTLTDLYHLRDGRLRRIDTILTLTNNCCCANAFGEGLSWRTEPDGANPPRIIATVTLNHAPKEFTDGCDRKLKPRTEIFESTYRWDATKGQYRDAGSNDFERLDKWNVRHM